MSVSVTIRGKSGLPLGVSLQEIDGGIDYFSSFSNVPEEWNTGTFFPLGKWDASLPAGGDETAVAAYEAVGINLMYALANGYTQTLLNQFANHGIYLANWEGYLDGPVPTDDRIVGHFWGDEADGNCRCPEMPTANALGETVPCTCVGGRTPPSAIAQAAGDYHGDHGAGDPTRFVLAQYTKPVSLGAGLSWETRQAYVAAADVISFDHYIVNDGWETLHDLWTQYDEVSVIRELANYSKPIWSIIECPSPFEAAQWSGHSATPEIVVAEVWNAIIGGARGIVYFDIDYCGATCGYPGGADCLISSNSGYDALQTAVGNLNTAIIDLSPVIHSDFAIDYVTVSVTNGRQMNMMAKYYEASDKFYVFAAPRFTQTETATYDTAGTYSGPVTVYGESRTVTATNGTFSDGVAGQTAYHIYEVPNS